MRGLKPFNGLCWFILLVCSQLGWTQSFTPAAYPLAVRSPYFSTWLNATNGTSLTNVWPRFWSMAGTHLNGWAGLIRVDGTTYRWLGLPLNMNTSTLISTQVTPTRTILTVQAGPMELTVTFLTPIEPTDWVRQSMPFSYLSLEASSTDGNSHSVQVYSDVSAEWLSGNTSSPATWNTTSTNQIIYHQVSLQNPTAFGEVNDQAVDGSLFYAISQGTSATYQSGPDVDVRGQFSSKGALLNSQDTNYRAISDDWPVFGLAVDLGDIQSTSSPMVWTVGYVRDPSIQYITRAGTVQNRSPYYVTEHSGVIDAMEAFVSDFSDASSRMSTLDDEITQSAQSISSEYSDIVSLAARQTFGSLDITVSRGTDGQWNTSDAMIFMKNLGNNRRVNPVEILYAAFPMFLYVNASYAGGLLTPLLDYQMSSTYTLPYAASEIGSGYPIASGDSSSNELGVEQSANMIIMAYAHARISGNGALLVEYHDLLRKWADYLVQNAKTPSNQFTADGQSSANMTNLAIKGIVAIEAMAQISAVLGNSSAASYYSQIAAADTSTWESLALSQDSSQGLLFTYGSSNTWALTYNLYADRLLQTNLVSESVYDRQGDYYYSLITDGTLRTYGLPLDSAAAVQGNSAWLSYTAATTNSTVRDQFIDMIWKRASYNGSAGVFPATYDVDSGAATGGIASPAQGAMFSLLALDLKNTTISTAPISSSSSSKTRTKTKTNLGAIIGGAVGGGVALILVVAFFWWWRRKANSHDVYEKGNLAVPQRNTGLVPYIVTANVSAPDTEHVWDITNTNEPSPPIPLISTKMREHMRQTQLMQSPTSPTSYRTRSQTNTSASGSRYSVNPPTTVGTEPSARSEIHGLREEVENLRRYMQELQAHHLEAPPSYVEE